MYNDILYSRNTGGNNKQVQGELRKLSGVNVAKSF